MERSKTKQTQPTHRGGFTLVELLVVIAIIGILVSMLAVSIGPVLTRVQEGAVTVEMQQLDLAVESFRTQHGFYPPSFNPDGITGPAQLLPFLNKISPNHRELTDMPGAPAGTTRLQVWWENVGCKLDERSSLVFWLSGVCANKQFPLTGGALGDLVLPVPFNSETQAVFLDDLMDKEDNVLVASSAIARDSFFDFKGAQLVDPSEGKNLFPAESQAEMDIREAANAYIRIYLTPYRSRKRDSGKSYFYRDSGSYFINDPTMPKYDFPVCSHNGASFVNPRTFQIFTFGRDGEAAIGASMLGAITDNSIIVNRDNLTNFANGRLETFDASTIAQ